MKKVISFLFLTSILFLTQACDKLEAQEEANLGKSALQNCEFENARKHFQKAHDLYPSHEDILIGLAISEIADYASTKEIEDIMRKIGFNKTLASLCLENLDDSKDENSDENLCKTLELSDFFKDQNDTSEAFRIHTSEITPELVWSDILNTLNNQNDELLLAAEHFQEAARILDERTWRVDFFGYEDIGFHKADFAAFSAAFYLIHAAVIILSDYQFDFSVKETADAIQNNDDETLATIINENLLIHKPDEFNAPAAQAPIFQLFQSIALAAEGMQYLYDLKKRPEEFDVFSDSGCLQRRSLFHWEKTMPGIIKDLDKTSTIFEETDTILSLGEFLMPDVHLDLDQLLSNLPERNKQKAIVTVNNGEWTWSLNDEIITINQSFAPAIFNTHAFSLDSDISFRLDTAWAKFDFSKWL